MFSAAARLNRAGIGLEHGPRRSLHSAAGLYEHNRFVIRFLPVKTVVLLTISNIFMNLAWYGHLKFRSYPLWIAILASWGLAFFEYLFQVPANRIGSAQWTVPQLKILQECITLLVFTVIAFALFRSPFRWNIAAAYGCIIGAVYFAFRFQ